jgi:hypothetical protein
LKTLTLRLTSELEKVVLSFRIDAHQQYKTK